VGLPASTFYRRTRLPVAGSQVKLKPRSSHRALPSADREHILAVLNSDRFGDKPPAQIHAALLDEGVYVGSVSTMYRILRKNDLVRERRNILRHPEYVKPELLATRPNQVWSWDITKLKSPQKWKPYHLYVMIDIYSRYVVGWQIATRENGDLASDFIEETCKRQDIEANHRLFIHADRGTSMRSKSVALLMADLGITKTHSRPHVSNDNPFSESHFKTLKYQPLFPSRFGSIEHARLFCRDFFDNYNEEHYHSGIGYLTPSMVHYGSAEECIRRRHKVLLEMYEKFPERFVKGRPKAIEIPPAVWINRPQEPDTISSITIISDSEVSVS
jgi:putative transposase